jgi:hypothetical protein
VAPRGDVEGGFRVWPLGGDVEGGFRVWPLGGRLKVGLSCRGGLQGVAPRAGCRGTTNQALSWASQVSVPLSSRWLLVLSQWDMASLFCSTGGRRRAGVSVSVSSVSKTV